MRARTRAAANVARNLSAVLRALGRSLADELRLLRDARSERRRYVGERSNTEIDDLGRPRLGALGPARRRRG